MVPWQMHNILMGGDRLTQNVGVDRLTQNMGGDRRPQNTLDSEFNLISKSLDTGPQTLRWSAGRPVPDDNNATLWPNLQAGTQLQLSSKLGRVWQKMGSKNIWSKIIVSRKTLVQNLYVPKHYCVPKYFWVSQVLVLRGCD